MNRTEAMADPDNTSASTEVTDGIYFAVPRQILASEEIDWSFPSDQQVMQQAERDQHPYVPSNPSSDRPRLMDHFEPDVDEYLLRCSLDKFESQTVSSFRNNIITQLSATLQDISINKDSDENDELSSSGDEDANHQIDQKYDTKQTNVKRTEVKLSSVYKNNFNYPKQGKLIQTNVETDFSQGSLTSCLSKNGDLKNGSSDSSSNYTIKNNVLKMTNDGLTIQSNDSQQIDTLMITKNGLLITKSDQISTSPVNDSFIGETHETTQDLEEIHRYSNGINVSASSDNIHEEKTESNSQTHIKDDRSIEEPVRNNKQNNQVHIDDPFFTATLRRNLRLEDDDVPMETSHQKNDSDTRSIHQQGHLKGHNGAVSVSPYNIGHADDCDFTLSLRRNLLLEDDRYPDDEQLTIISEAKNDIKHEDCAPEGNHIREKANLEHDKTECANRENENSTANLEESFFETNDAGVKSAFEKGPGMMHMNPLSKQSLFLHSMINEPNDIPLQSTVSSTGSTSRESDSKVCEELLSRRLAEKIKIDDGGQGEECEKMGSNTESSQLDFSNNEQKDLEGKCGNARSELVTRADDCVSDNKHEESEDVNNFKSKFEGSHVQELSEDGKNPTPGPSMKEENEVCFQENDDSLSQSFVPKCLPRTSKSLKTLGSIKSSSDATSDIDDSAFKILEVQKYFREKTAKFSVSDVILETPEEYADPTPETPDQSKGVNEIESNLVSNHFALTPTPSPRNIRDDVMIISVSDEDSNETVETRVVIKKPSADRKFESSKRRDYVKPASPSPHAVGFNPSVSPDPADWAKHLTISRDQQHPDLSPSPESSSSSLWLSCSEEDRQVNLLNYDIFRTDFSDADPDLNSAWPFAITNDQPKECPNVFYSECYALHL